VTPAKVAATDEEVVIPTRRLPHGLAAVLIPSGLSRAEENCIRLVLGLPPRPPRRREGEVRDALLTRMTSTIGNNVLSSN
jgi:hypothetical protein